jgi:hypothetical protein
MEDTTTDIFEEASDPQNVAELQGDASEMAFDETERLTQEALQFSHKPAVEVSIDESAEP